MVGKGACLAAEEPAVDWGPMYSEYGSGSVGEQEDNSRAAALNIVR
ncbi:MAG: hypothetical protein MUO27_07210 [Sedimentisphaerales bacterium]|nr:hypothetical protein [Sedimentisphaerales bacterium]